MRMREAPAGDAAGAGFRLTVSEQFPAKPFKAKPNPDFWAGLGCCRRGRVAGQKQPVAVGHGLPGTTAIGGPLHVQHYATSPRKQERSTLYHKARSMMEALSNLEVA